MLGILLLSSSPRNRSALQYLHSQARWQGCDDQDSAPQHAPLGTITRSMLRTSSKQVSAQNVGRNGLVCSSLSTRCVFYLDMISSGLIKAVLPVSSSCSHKCSLCWRFKDESGDKLTHNTNPSYAVPFHDKSHSSTSLSLIQFPIFYTCLFLKERKC